MLYIFPLFLDLRQYFLLSNICFVLILHFYNLSIIVYVVVGVVCVVSGRLGSNTKGELLKFGVSLFSVSCTRLATMLYSDMGCTSIYSWNFILYLDYVRSSCIDLTRFWGNLMYVSILLYLSSIIFLIF